MGSTSITTSLSSPKPVDFDRLKVVGAYTGLAERDREFADSPLEGSGFEL
jgi:hypothetical protein